MINIYRRKDGAFVTSYVSKAYVMDMLAVNSWHDAVKVLGKRGYSVEES